MEEQEIQIGDDKLTVMPLGAGQEVGRSCHILEYHGVKIMLDCGIHPAYENIGSLPFLDAIDPESINVVLITHFHIDHIAAVPWFLTQTAYNGPCYMTHQTKAISKTLLLDYVGVSSQSSDEPNLFTKTDLENCQKKITQVAYKQTVTYRSVKMTPYPAGHVLGACMWLIEIDGVKILYTGDYSLEHERHLSGAEIDGEVVPLDVLIIESTHGISRIERREEREYRFIDNVTKIIRRGGRCLIPIFALGRAQELLLILDEYWEQHKDEYEKVPIYYGSNLAKKSIDVYNSYNQSTSRDPIVSARGKLDFMHIKYIEDYDEDFDDSMPCVVLCSPAMLQNGMSRKIFEQWCSNPVNGLIIPGYVVEGTLPDKLTKYPEEVETLSGKMIQRRITIESISFSGHADFTQTSRFISELKPKNVVLVHGVRPSMMALKEKLNQMFMEDGIQVFTPALCEEAVMTFQSNPSAIVTGNLADEKEHLSGLIVRKDGQNIIMSAADLNANTTLKTISAQMTLDVVINRPLKDYVPLLESHFDSVQVLHKKLILISERLMINMIKDNIAQLQWDADPTLDMLADNVAMMLGIYSGDEETFKKPETNDSGTINDAFVSCFIHKLEKALQQRYSPDIVFDEEAQLFIFDLNGDSCVISMDPSAPNGVNVDCGTNTQLANDINELAANMYEFAFPISLHK